MNSNSLDIIVKADILFKSNIHCPLHKVCNLLCINETKCSNVNIYANDTLNIHLLCDESSICQNITIYGHNTNQVSITCFASNYTTCANITIYASHAKNIKLECLKDNLDGTACRNMLIYAEHSFNLDIICKSETIRGKLNICDSITIFADKIKNKLNVVAIGDYTLNNSIINAALLDTSSSTLITVC